MVHAKWLEQLRVVSEKASKTSDGKHGEDRGEAAEREGEDGIADRGENKTGHMEAFAGSGDGGDSEARHKKLLVASEQTRFES